MRLAAREAWARASSCARASWAAQGAALAVAAGLTCCRRACRWSQTRRSGASRGRPLRRGRRVGAGAGVSEGGSTGCCTNPRPGWMVLRLQAMLVGVTPAQPSTAQRTHAWSRAWRCRGPRSARRTCRRPAGGRGVGDERVRVRRAAGGGWRVGARRPRPCRAQGNVLAHCALTAPSRLRRGLQLPGGPRDAPIARDCGAPRDPRPTRPAHAPPAHSPGRRSAR